MKIYEAEEAYTFDDVVLVPRFSTIKSRKDPNTKTKIGNIELDIPIMSSPMNTITAFAMAREMSAYGGDSVVHRYMTIDNQCLVAANTIGHSKRPFFAIGATGDFIERAEMLNKVGVTKFCINVANGHSISCVEAIKKLRAMFDDK